MYPPASPSKHSQWTRDGFLISTDPSLIDLKTLNAAFGSDFLYWAKPLPESAMKDMLDNSLNFGLYAATGDLPPIRPNRDDMATGTGIISPASAGETSLTTQGAETNSQPKLIGFSRLITDNITFAYLTDVYILEEWRGQRLGEWLIACVQETLDTMPWLRRSMAILGDRGLAGWYEKHMGMKLIEDGPNSGFWVIQKRGGGSAFG